MATLPDARITQTSPLYMYGVGFDFTVPTVFGTLSVETVPADALTHTKLQISYSC